MLNMLLAAARSHAGSVVNGDANIAFNINKTFEIARANDKFFVLPLFEIELNRFLL